MVKKAGCSCAAKLTFVCFHMSVSPRGVDGVQLGSLLFHPVLEMWLF